MQQKVPMQEVEPKKVESDLLKAKVHVPYRPNSET
jgi:hypothetical protein